MAIGTVFGLIIDVVLLSVVMLNDRLVFSGGGGSIEAQYQTA